MGLNKALFKNKYRRSNLNMFTVYVATVACFYLELAFRLQLGRMDMKFGLQITVQCSGA